MQITEANKDAALIGVCSSECECLPTKTKANILMTFGLGGYAGKFSLSLPQSLGAIIQPSALGKKSAEIAYRCTLVKPIQQQYIKPGPSYQS